MCTEEIFFTIFRESLGFEPFIKKADPSNKNHKIKNTSFRIKECQKFLELREDQVKNAINIDLLKTETISGVLYICIYSALKIKDSPELLEKITDEDQLTTNVVGEILELTTKNVRRLIDEGYLTVVATVEFKYGLASLIKRGEVRKLKDQIPEIKDFWKSKTKINRQMGAKKAVATRQNPNYNPMTFKADFFDNAENLPYKDAKLMKACLSLLSLNYYIERKLSKNIVDQELIDLKNKSLEKLTKVSTDITNIKLYYIQGEDYVHFCSSCMESIKELKYNFKISWDEAHTLSYYACKKCRIDKDYFSIIVFFVQIYEYTFILNASYKDIKPWFKPNHLQHTNKGSWLYPEEDKGLIGITPISDEQLKTYKIFEVINHLKEFINSKDLDFSLNI
ncbi:MAG: hypothetical protein H7263_07470 [Candidatus Sericytochromatia bacterium]|nr:hypothetical protein [Candidatus Sericytochromatia bacterium]